MKSRERTKNYKAEPQSEGSIWELCLFAVFFVIVFSTIARADENSTASIPNRSVAAVAKSSAAKSSTSKSIRPARSSKARTQKSSAITVAQNENQNPAPAESTKTEAVANPGANPIRARQEQLSPIPTNAISDSNLRASLPEPALGGPRFAPSAKLTVETTATVSTEEKRSFGGWYQLALALQDKQTNTALSVKAGYAREFSYQKDDNTDGDIDNPTASLSKTWKEGEQFRSPIFDTITLGLSGAVAASREARRRTFIGSIGPSLTLSKAVRKFTVGLGGGYSRGFYGYDIRDDGTVNSPDQFRGTAELSYAITEKLSLSGSMVYTYGISFQKVGKATELSSFSIDYQVLKKLGLSLGVATERGTLEADGYTNDVKLFDANVAQAFFDLILSF